MIYLYVTEMSSGDSEGAVQEKVPDIQDAASAVQSASEDTMVTAKTEQSDLSLATHSQTDNSASSQLVTSNEETVKKEGNIDEDRECSCSGKLACVRGCLKYAIRVGGKECIFSVSL